MNNQQLVQMNEEIRNKLNGLNNQLGDFEHLSKNEKNEFIENCEQEKQKIDQLFLKLQKNAQFNDSFQHVIDSIQENLDSYQIQFKKLKENFYQIDIDQQSDNQENNDMLNEGEKLFQQGMKIADNMLKDLDVANQTMEDIEQEIVEQRIKLLKTKDTLKDAHSLTKRSQELVGYFSKMMLKDKLIRFFAFFLFGIVLLSLGALVLIINEKKSLQQQKMKLMSQQDTRFVLDKNQHLILDPKIIEKQIQEQNQHVMSQMNQRLLSDNILVQFNFNNENSINFFSDFYSDNRFRHLCKNVELNNRNRREMC